VLEKGVDMASFDQTAPPGSVLMYKNGRSVWVPPEKQPPAIRAGLVAGERCFRDVAEAACLAKRGGILHDQAQCWMSQCVLL